MRADAGDTAMQFLVSATRKSSGKTVVSVGLCAELKARGGEIRAFKKGPDYIDPQWLAQASGHACYNLDFYTQSHEEIRALAAARSPAQGFSLIEANKGLFDGVAADGGDSNAALAKLLGIPVVLVVDCEGMTRGIAPLLQGYRAFDAEVTIAGVILNRVGGERHRAKLTAAVENYSDVPVLGAIMRDARLQLPERHLGLTPSAETDDAAQKIEDVREAVAAQVDVDLLLQAVGASAGTSVSGPRRAQGAPVIRPPPPDGKDDKIKLAVFKDQAFHFYYPDDLEDLERCGVELAFVDGLRDARLPPADGLFIGGGFPETQAAALQANGELRGDVARAIQRGLPAYAECGGLMYLSRGITWQGRRYEMCGAIEADTLMCDAPQGRGYVEFSETGHMPWPAAEDAPPAWRAHEFHHSRLVNAAPFDTAYAVSRGAGLGDGSDGIVHKNLLASYLHRRATGAERWTSRFVRFIRQNIPVR